LNNVDGSQKLNPYLSAIQSTLPRVLSLLDPESFSKTRGCADRTWWAWKFTDFPGARYQEIAYTLAWVWSRSPEPWGLRHNAEIKQWFIASLDFWTKTAYENGSFDEAYPWEQSMAATAFSLFYVTEALILDPSLTSDDPAILQGVMRTIERAASWLKGNRETHGILSNHLAVAAAALYNAGTILKREDFLKSSDNYLNVIYGHQDAREGWYEEYGGADPGYQSHGAFYLSRIWQRSKCPDLLKSLQRSNEFLAHFITPDGSFGGEFGSRNTTFWFPAFGEILAEVCPHASAMTREMRRHVASGNVVSLLHMDAQNLFPMLNNWLFAFDNFQLNNGATGDSTVPLPLQTLTGARLFNNAGILIWGSSSTWTIASFKKGGVVYVWNRTKNRLIWQSAGYVTSRGSRLYTTQHAGAQIMAADTNGFVVKQSLVRMKRPVFGPWLFMGFRLFSVTLGRSRFLARALKNILVKVLVRQRSRKPSDLIVLDRRVSFLSDGVLVEDATTNLDPRKHHQNSFSAIHMGSSRYPALSHIGNRDGSTSGVVHTQYVEKQGKCTRVVFRVLTSRLKPDLNS
jgi:hypothetical protein